MNIIATLLLLSLSLDAAPRLDVRYGSHARNLLDFYPAQVSHPAPVVVFIHGGGYASGDKSQVRRNPIIGQMHAAGIHVAGINYRFVVGKQTPSPLPAPLFDCARAVQFLKSKSKEWNIDPHRFGAFGGSAGGAASLWLAFHQDLAEPNHTDPVRRQSSRLACVAPINGPCSSDPRWIEAHLKGVKAEWFRNYTLKDYGARTLAELNQPAIRKRIEEACAIPHLTRDDPPAYIQHTHALAPITGPRHPGGLIHSAHFGVQLKKSMDKLGIINVLVIAKQPASGTKDPYGSMANFFRVELLKKRLKKRLEKK